MRLLAALVLTLALAGCSSAPPPAPEFPRITFQSKPPFRIEVAHIDIDRSYDVPRSAPHVAHLFPESPAQAARNWAVDRLRASGKSGVLHVSIQTADAIEVPLPRTTGLRGAFTRDQSEQYVVTVALRLELSDPATGRSAVVDARAERTASTAEDSSMNDRRALWYRMTDGVMSDLDQELERQIRQIVAAFMGGAS